MIKKINRKLASRSVLASLLVISLVNCGGGGSDSGSAEPTTPTVPAVDTVPNSFSFNSVTDVALETVIESNQITISGINAEASISISGGEYAIDNADFTSATGTIANGASIQVRAMSSSEALTATNSELTIGGVSATFTVTTQAVQTFTGVNIDINFNTKHTVGDVDTFDRQKFITLHASHLENGWVGGDVHSRNAPNEDPDLMVNFMTDNDVYFGRDTGSIGWNLRNLPEDSDRSGFVDEAATTTRGNDSKWGYTNFSSKKYIDARLVEHRANDMIMGGQQHPYWPEGTDIASVGAVTPWAFSQTDTADEPLGTATGHYMGQFLAKFFNTGSPNLGQVKPKYFEVMNEPLYDLTTVRDGADKVEPYDVFRFHNSVAAEIKKTNAEQLVGGYTVAFPDFEKDNFSRWENRDKLFIDTAGANMDFYAVHLYDFPAFQNSERYRRGSNLEATLDMLEHYSLLAIGEVKPVVISEYGAAIHTMFNEGWNPQRNSMQIRALNSMLMAFMERPNVIAKTIPFNVVKAEWGRTTVPYGPRLMVQKFERDGAEAGDEWVYSDLVLFYQLWSEVNGTRIDTWSSDLDVLVDAYVEDNTAYVILNNLEFDEQEIKLNSLGIDSNNLNNISIKHLVSNALDESSITVSQLENLDDTITLEAESTMVIKLEFANAITIDQTNTETKYYATTYKQEILANEALEFSINDVTLGDNGEAILRLGIGRAHQKSLMPSVEVNAVPVTVAMDFRGYDQVNGKTLPGRESFFGVIEIPVNYADLQQNNTIKVQFSDDGGYLSSAALQVFNTSIPLTRTH